MILQHKLRYTPSVVSLSPSSLCPPCASAFLARRSSERGWRVLYMLIPGHRELHVGLICLLGHQHATRGAGEVGRGSWQSRAPAGSSALNSSSSSALQAIRCGLQALVLFGRWKSGMSSTLPAGDGFLSSSLPSGVERSLVLFGG